MEEASSYNMKMEETSSYLAACRKNRLGAGGSARLITEMIEKFRLWLRRWLEVPEAQVAKFELRGSSKGVADQIAAEIARAAPAIIKASVAASRRDDEGRE